ncbi:hypothetical protein [Hydrogenophaga sp.]|uniref:hypothetical protein n=2 Tax=Hydrogenophaga sp. TaxID=1904254 RepID=UPI002AC9D752|nr:hypothetical protein [Hydrogenophaga sp.]
MSPHAPPLSGSLPPEGADPAWGGPAPDRMSSDAGYFMDWDGNVRRTDDPGGGYRCDVDRGARYVGVLSKSGALVHEATFYKDQAALDKAGIKGTLVPGSHPWGKEGAA